MHILHSLHPCQISMHALPPKILNSCMLIVINPVENYCNLWLCGKMSLSWLQNNYSLGEGANYISIDR